MRSAVDLFVFRHFWSILHVSMNRDTKHEEQALGELEDYLDWLRQSLRHAVQGKEVSGYQDVT